MATLPKAGDPGYPDIYELGVDDPVAGGPDGVDNLPHKQLAERSDWLRERVETALSSINGLGGRLEFVEASASSAIGRAVPLAWDLDDRGYRFELWVPVREFSWRDHHGVALIGAVAGDDSIDVASTAGLLVGQSYVITTPTGDPIHCTVAEILSGTRLTLTANMPRSATEGTLARTNWVVSAGYATAPDKGVIYSRDLDAVRHFEDGRVVIRRDAGDGILTVSWRPRGQSAWRAATLLSSTEVEIGTRDETWVLGGGFVEVRVTSAHGLSAKDTRVEHMVLHVGPRAGLAEIVATPSGVSPAHGAASVATATPTLKGSDYKSLYGRAHAASQWQVATDEDFLNLVIDSGAVTAAPLTEVMLGSGLLQTGKNYHWRLRYKDIDGVWSAWSPRRSFSTGAAFAYVVKPVVISPAAGATGVPVHPTLQSTPFAAVGGADTLELVHWQVATDPAFNALVLNQGVAPTYLVLTSALTALATYYVRVRHKGISIGWSDWSTVVQFRVQAVPGVPVALAPTSDNLDVPMAPTLTSSSFFVPGSSDTHVASQWQVAADEDFTALATDSGEVAGLTAWQVPAGALDSLVTYKFRVRHKGATIGWSAWSAPGTFTVAHPVGTVAFTSGGIHAWQVPPGVKSISGVAISNATLAPSSGKWGNGGGLAWKNNIPVTPGQVISISVPQSSGAYGGGTASVGGIFAANSGGPINADGGGAGGRGDLGGGGAGGYLGPGGNGATAAAAATAGRGGGGSGGGNNVAGGGVSLFGLAAGVTADTYSPAATGSSSGYGGGNGYVSNIYPQAPGPAGVRLIWGRGRSYPYNAA